MKYWLPLFAFFGAACSSSGTWRRVETPHFVLNTDFDSGEAKHAAVALEETRDALVSAAWPHAKFKEERTYVYLLANGMEFERYFGKITAGLFFHSSPPVFFLYGSPSKWELRRSAHVPTQSTLRHEMAHQLSYDVWPRQPRWFAEGLANFLEPIYYSDDEKSIVLGGVNFNAYHEYRQFRAAGVEDAFAWNRGIGRMAQREVIGLYGISWLLVHWLYNQHPDALVKYIDQLQTGIDPEVCLRDALPTLDASAINKEIFEYQKHGQFVEIARDLVSSNITEASLKDEVLDESQVKEIKAIYAEASKRHTGQTHGESETAQGVLKQNDLGGKVTGQFTIEKNGTVEKAAPVCTTLPDKEVVACVVDRIKETKFPKPTGDGAVNVVYPIMLAPK